MAKNFKRNRHGIPTWRTNLIAMAIKDHRYVIALVGTKLKQKPFLSLSVDDERFEWLISTILPYFTNWKNSIESRRGGPYSNTDKARLFISWQTHDHTFINRSYKIPFQVKYVLTERFCPDPLENYFGRQRCMGRHRDNPNKNF